MKRHYLILTAIAILAFAAMSCGIQFVGANPTPVPQQIPQNLDPMNQGPVNQGPDNVVPQGPDNVNPGQGPQGQDNSNPGANPNGGGPGDIQLFTADQMTLKQGDCTNLHWQTQGGFGVKLSNQPVPPVGQQQICPAQTTVYELGLDVGSQTLTRQVTITVNGGNQSQGPAPVQPTATKKSGGGNNPGGGTSNTSIDLSATDMFMDPKSLGYTLHIGVKNNSSYSGNITFSVTCAGIQYTSKSTKNNFVNLMYSANGLIYPFNAKQERWTNTYIKLDKGTGYYELTCTLNSSSDNNKSNNSVSKTFQINP